MNTFDDFWKMYPRRVSKKDARKAWDKAIKIELSAMIIRGLERQLPYLESRPLEFRPHPATWLNGERWDDEVQIQAAPIQKQTAFQQRHQTAIDAFDRKLGLKPNDEFAGSNFDLEPADWRAH